SYGASGRGALVRHGSRWRAVGGLGPRATAHRPDASSHDASASAMRAASPAGTRVPPRPASTYEPTPPTSVATIGRPDAIASSTALGELSNSEASANTSAVRYSAGSS